MSNRVISVAWHGLVLAVLMVLTAGTLGFSFADVSPQWHRTVALGIAAIQSALIVLFFMHGLTSSKLTWAVIAVSVFWLAAILFALTFSDYATREGFPYVPGH